ncbi:MAG: hypothetical protein CMP48_01050 [Rickettsiales bacterium]|nr:hypothetical protein [Rickettsiales bacterium]|tara:strand:- start:310 stop:528 length:219 start_codon:yes stop_codon:yes gene_type:complete
MSIDTRKLQIIEKFIQSEDPLLIDRMEALLNKADGQLEVNLHSLKGIWSDDEANEIRQIITDGCEKIDHDNW